MPLNIPRQPAATAPIDQRDKDWFALHPERRQRVRMPFAEELTRANLLGLLQPLKQGQEYAVLVQDLGSHWMSQIVAVRLDQSGVFPDSDDAIDRGFRRPNVPKGVPA